MGGPIGNRSDCLPPVVIIPPRVNDLKIGRPTRRRKRSSGPRRSQVVRCSRRKRTLLSRRSRVLGSSRLRRRVALPIMSIRLTLSSLGGVLLPKKSRRLLDRVKISHVSSKRNRRVRRAI